MRRQLVRRRDKCRGSKHSWRKRRSHSPRLRRVRLFRLLVRSRKPSLLLVKPRGASSEVGRNEKKPTAWGRFWRWVGNFFKSLVSPRTGSEGSRRSGNRRSRSANRHGRGRRRGGDSLSGERHHTDGKDSTQFGP